MGLFSFIGKALSSVAQTVADAVLPGIGGDIVGSLASSLGVQMQEDEAREYQQDLLNQQQNFSQFQAQQAHQWNLEDWQRNNEYNSPAAQRERLEAAGYNPLLANVGNGLSSAITSTPAASPAAPSSDLSAVASMISAVSQSTLAKAQAKNVEADTELKETDLETRSDLNIANLDYIRANTDLSEEQKNELIAKINLLEEEEKKVIEEKRGLRIDNDIKSKTIDDAVDLIRAKVKCTKEQANLFISQALQAKSIKELNDIQNRFFNDTYWYRELQERYKADYEQWKSENEHWSSEQTYLDYLIDSDTKEALKYITGSKEILSILLSLIKALK